MKFLCTCNQKIMLQIVYDTLLLYIILIIMLLVYTNCDNDIRLVGGNSVSEGRVEMCFNGVWGSICNYGWDNIDATVVCKKLGFQAESKQTKCSSKYFTTVL